jgi:hypothetical protein
MFRQVAGWLSEESEWYIDRCRMVSLIVVVVGLYGCFGEWLVFDGMDELKEKYVDVGFFVYSWRFVIH